MGTVPEDKIHNADVQYKDCTFIRLGGICAVRL